MKISNSTGKNKDFYDLGKKMFDRLNPQIAHNPKVIGYVAPQREWVGLTDEEVTEVAQHFTESEGFRHGVDWAEAKLKEKNT